MKNITPILLMLTCFSLSPIAQAVSPPPDGGYAGGNTAEGQNALLSLTTGVYNTAVGLFSLEITAEGSFNTATGAGALLLNAADENTATGAGALLSNTTGTPNTANGAFALFSNTTGNNDNAFGFEALFSNTTGPFNNAFGNGALAGNTTGDRNTAIGEGALLANTTGFQNIAIGVSALRNNVTGNDNIAIGQDACSQSQGGQFNTAVGADALVLNTADDNTAIGGGALANSTAGAGNTAIGAGALSSNTTGSNNIAIGINAGFNLTTFGGNIDVGNAGMPGDVDTIRIGDTTNANTIAFMAGIADAGVTGTAVFVSDSGQLGVAVSSRRFKNQIEPMNNASESIFTLKPVTFRYKREIDPAGTTQFGLVAEEVEKVDPDLVVRDKEGKPYSVRYDQVNAMLLNEFLKEHKAFLEEQRKMQELEKRTAALAAAVDEQAVQIQKVSARGDASRPGLQLAGSHR